MSSSEEERTPLLSGKEPDFESPEEGMRYDPKRLIGITHLTLLLYFTVSGGPIGTEEAISSVGPVIGLLAICVFPWIYSMPIALTSAELSTAFPDDGGYTLWVEEAFGRFAAIQEGYWSWISGVIDNAMYPVLITQILIDEEEPTEYWQFTVAVSFGISLLNFSGIRLIGRILFVLGVVVISPYVILAVCGYYRFLFPGEQEQSEEELRAAVFHALSHKRWKPDWIKLLNVLFWNYSGWDSASTFAGEVKDPSRTYPIALCYAVTFVSLSYILPLSASVASGVSDWHSWTDGDLIAVGKLVGGEWLYRSLIFSGICSAIAMFSTELFIDSFLLCGMAEHKLVPTIFAQKDARDTPYMAICMSLVVIFIAVRFLDFDLLLYVNNCLASMSILLEIIAAIYLRIYYPSLKRPYKIPVTTMGFVLMLLPSALVLCTLIISALLYSPSIVKAFLMVIILFGVGFERAVTTYYKQE